LLRSGARGRLWLAETDGGSGKGFGKKKEPTAAAMPLASESTAATESASEQTTLPTSTSSSSSFESKFESTNYYKTEIKKREAALDEKIAKLREEEELMASDPSVGAVPELVANRMLSRIVVLAGIPVFGGLAIFVGAFFYFKKFDLVVPPAMIAYATQAPFILGLLGITYAIFSSSWDKEEGSILGVSEFKTNLQRVKDGLKRTSDTAKLKEEISRESDRLGRK